MENRFKLKKCLIALLIVLLVLITFNIFVSISMSVYADTPNSTNVLTDLQKDPNFKVSDYQDKADDYSIQVIQIAESTAKEFLIYTYQPAQRTCYLIATSVNMSLSEDVQGTKLYDLEFLSCEGVFCKYKVKDVVVADTEYRYYNITSIYRAWNKDFDDPSGNDNTINEVAFEVGKLYKASTIDGKVSYSYDKMETIEIINPYTGFLQYSNGFFLYNNSCRSHYIAFDTDKQIDELYEATVSYISQKVVRKIGGMTGDIIEEEKEIPHPNELIDREDKGETPANGIFSKKYEWKRIQKTEDFIKDPINDLKENVKEDLKKTKWVLRFVETDYIYKTGASSGLVVIDTEEYTKIEKVTILRLKFRTGIKIYDLGTISNKITGSNTNPDNNNTNELDPLGWLWRKLCELADKLGIPVWLIILFIVIIFLAILLPVLSLIFPVVGQVLKVALKAVGKAVVWIFKALVWIVVLPIKGIVLLVNKCKGGGSA